MVTGYLGLPAHKALGEVFSYETMSHHGGEEVAEGCTKGRTLGEQQ